VLGIVPRPIEETLVDCAGSLTAASDWPGELPSQPRNAPFGTPVV